ncbi:RTA1 like protein-domain-containing protein [Bisporella sp. PMI_857]|nr:RTA1 like protein-domain-containing protein [Bisporella sp. PMI_857]
MNRTGVNSNGKYYGNETLYKYPELCTLDTCDLTLSPFRYRPTVPGNIIFASIFSIFVVGQLFLGIKHKTWGYMIAMLLGLLLEILGYLARVLLYNNSFDRNYFLMSLVALTIAPAFLTAGIYLCLARIVHVYGAYLSYFKPRTYTLVFCACDIISLVLQALGGAFASSANTKADSNLGKNIMMIGLGFQVFSLLLFAGCAGEFALRVWKNKNNWNPRYIDLVNTKLFKAFLFGLFIATITIFVRSTYRCVELSGGFDSHLFVADELAFMILEGVMIVVATACLTLLHPAVCFQGAWEAANFKFRTNKGDSEKLMSHNSFDGTTYGNVELASVPPAHHNSL